MLLLGVLQAQAAGAGVEGDFVLLDERVLDSAESSVTFSSLSTYAADYQHLQIRGVIRTNRAGQTNSESSLRINGDTGANYSLHFLRGTGSAVQSAAGTSQTSISISDGTSSTNATASSYSAFVMDILDPFSSSKNTTVRFLFGNAATTYFGSGDIRLGSGAYLNTASVTSLSIIDRNATTIAIGSRFSLYGIRGG
jgi:hypothetical protein